MLLRDLLLLLVVVVVVVDVDVDVVDVVDDLGIQ